MTNIEVTAARHALKVIENELDAAMCLYLHAPPALRSKVLARELSWLVERCERARCALNNAGARVKAP
jgi:hypothetical protein